MLMLRTPHSGTCSLCREMLAGEERGGGARGLFGLGWIACGGLVASRVGNWLGWALLFLLLFALPGENCWRCGGRGQAGPGWDGMASVLEGGLLVWGWTGWKTRACGCEGGGGRMSCMWFLLSLFFSL